MSKVTPKNLTFISISTLLQCVILINCCDRRVFQSVRYEFDAQVLADGCAGAVPVRRAVPPADLGLGAGRPRRRPAGGHRPPLARSAAAVAKRGGRRQSRRPQTGRRGGQ